MKEITERLLRHPAYRSRLQKLEQAEACRIYCKHDREHFSETARIGKRIIKQYGLDISEEKMELAAWLHDMGRIEQYEREIPHNVASEKFAEEILCALDYPAADRDEITLAVSQHGRRKAVAELLQDMEKIDSLAGLLCVADQLSRKCYRCPAAEGCKWTDAEKIKKEYF